MRRVRRSGLGRYAHLRCPGVAFVDVKILTIAPSQIGLTFEHEQVFRVFLLGLVREVETAGQDLMAIDDDDFVVSDGMLGVDEWRQTLFEQEG